MVATNKTNIGSYFNPWSNLHTNTRKEFKDLKEGKAWIIIATICATILTLPILGLGGLATFRKLTERKWEELNKPTDSTAAEQTHDRVNSHGIAKIYPPSYQNQIDKFISESNEKNAYRNVVNDLIEDGMLLENIVVQLNLHKEGQNEAIEQLLVPYRDIRPVIPTNKPLVETTPTKPVQENKSVKTVVKADYTQFKHGDSGRSACTCISFRAAEELIDKNFSDISAKELNKIIDNGVDMWKKTPKGNIEHLGIDDIDMSRSKLTKPESYDTFGGMISNFNTFLGDVLEKHANKTPFAIIITKPPETSCILVKSNKEFWLFDSHGDNSLEKTNEPKTGYVKKFGSGQELAEGLEKRFPSTDLDELNVFEGTVLIKK